MCRYRYYYFGTCRHQQTVLFDFCAEVQEVQYEPGKAAPAGISPREGEEQVQCGVDCSCYRRVADENTDPASFRSTTRSQTSLSTDSTAFEIGSASISIEPNDDCSSLPISGISTITSNDMAGYLLGDAFSRWMTGVKEPIEEPQYAIDSIEAEIDQLKEDVTRLRDAGESAASRLQRQHEAGNSATKATHEEDHDREPSLSPLDFPPLGNLSVASTKRADSKFSESSSGSSEPVVISKDQPSALNGKPIKSTPHFAQPTQSYSRRTGESVRGTISSSPTSPPKSVKAKEPCLATEKRANQRQQKRKSLPGDWVAGDSVEVAEQQSPTSTSETPIKAAKTPTVTQQSMTPSPVHSCPSSANGWQKVAKPNVKEQVNSNRPQSKPPAAASPLRSKRNMRPVSNNAAMTRTPITPLPPKTRLNSPPSTPGKVRAAHESIESMAAVQRSSTISSEASSVQFILDNNGPMLDSASERIDGMNRHQPVRSPKLQAQSDASTAAPPQASAPSNPPNQHVISKIPRPTDRFARQTPQQTSRNNVAVPTNVTRVAGFPEVSNTTVKRRLSHGHLLTPIMACLDAKGLLNKTATNNALLDSYLKSTAAKTFRDALKVARNSNPDSLNQVAETRPHEFDQSDGDLPGGPVLAPQSSLRATANEFRPTQTALATLTPEKLHDGYWSDEEWSKLNDSQRTAIYNIRQSFNSPSFNVQAGQILRPSVSPSKTVQWLLQDLDGRETQIKFGRAPPPTISPGFGTSTTSISSLGSPSPWKTPAQQALHQWQIRSTHSPVRYGWTGGDGKEIKFLGYGPHAERDPNSVVDFDFHGRRTSCNASIPNGFTEDQERSLSEIKVAPKSQREWAELLGYRKTPCGNIEITEAVEHCTPFGSQLAAYCHDCMAN